MSIFDLKKKVFESSKTLDRPLDFLGTRGCIYRPTTHVNAEFGSVYFYSGSRQTQFQVEGTFTDGDINSFEGMEYNLVLQCSPDHFDSILDKLKLAAKLAYDSGCLPLSAEICTTFDEFWKACRKPEHNCFRIDVYAWDKRKRVRQFINIYQYDNMMEWTGRLTIPKQTTLVASLRFSISETKSDDGVSVGIRPMIGAGLRIKQLGGNIPVIKSPWEWNNINYDTLSMPMYSGVSVRTPALRVLDIDEACAKVDREAKPLYTKAINHFHENAGAEPWNGSIEIAGPLKASVGGVIVATVCPSRNKNEILWRTTHYHASARRREVVEVAEAVHNHQNEETPRQMSPKKQKTTHLKQVKRIRDNKDNSFDESTKRQCT